MSSTNQQWWESLSPQWQQAFSLAILKKDNPPTEEDLEGILNMTVLRLAGPTAPHPNCNLELTDLSGVAALKNLQILIVSHHALSGIREVAELPALKSLFVFNNRITSLQGIEALEQLEQLYVNSNELSSIKEVTSLPNLLELFVNDNRLISLEGLTEIHADNLKKFICMPNQLLKPKEILRVERDLGILCR
jgi:Leucine-rich repeat (LRR) protein